MALLWTLWSCAGRDARQISDLHFIIDQVELDGVTRFSKREFLSYLHIGETRRLPFTDTFYYNESTLPLDIERIISLYHAYGYPDAVVTEIRKVQGNNRRVNLHIIVHEGDPILIDDLALIWPEGLPPRHGRRPATEQAIHSIVAMEPPVPLEIPTLEQRMDAIEVYLKQKGFPRVNVSSHAIIDEEAGRARLDITIRPGPFVRIGNIRIEGLTRVPENRVLTETEFARNRPFSPLLLHQIEQHVYAMDVFSTVETILAPDISTEGTADVLLRVRETHMQSVKITGSVAFDPTRWEEGVSFHYAHRNLFGRLTRLDTRMRMGYAQLPTPFNTQAHGPVLRLEPRLTRKGLLEKKLIWTLSPTFELGIEDGYRFYTPGTHAGLSRFFGQRLSVGLSHRFHYFDFFHISRTLETNRTQLGLDFRDPYMVSVMSSDILLYLTNRQLDPDNGIIVGFHYAIAGGILGGQYDFHKLTPSIRGYWQMTPRLQVAMRLETGLIHPYGSQPAVPFNLKYYLGGADTVRGWSPRRLSPKTNLCPPESTESCRPIPIGGNSMILANVEFRLALFRQLSMVSYLDAGDVAAGVNHVEPAAWNYAAGGGFRWNTPIGKFRLDIAARLNETLLSAGESRWAFHIGIGEAF